MLAKQAVDIIDDIPEEVSSYFIWSTDTFTEIPWVGAELSQRQCPQTKDHLDKAAQKLSTTPSQGGDLRFLFQLKALRKSFEATCPQQ